MTTVAPPLYLNQNANVNVEFNGAVSINTGTDSAPGSEFQFTTDGKMLIDGEPVNLGGGSTTAPTNPTTTPAASDSGWKAISLLGTWTNLGNTAVQNQANAEVRMIGKQVQLRGIVHNTQLTGPFTANIGKLPAGFYPGRQLHFIANSDDKPVSLKVQSDGYVYVIAGNPGFVSLEGVSFLID